MLNKIISARQEAEFTPTRRSFLIGSAAIAGGLMVGFKTSPGIAASGSNTLTGYIQITPDNKVTILSSQFEIGRASCRERV